MDLHNHQLQSVSAFLIFINVHAILISKIYQSHKNSFWEYNVRSNSPFATWFFYLSLEKRTLILNYSGIL